MDQLLQIKGLVKNFGGLRAIDNVDFSMQSGEIRAIIGPNGAGKTTFFNLISGTFKSSSGQIIFKGEDITDLPPFQIAKRGIVRTFQVSQIFPELQVFENVLLSAQSDLIKAFGIFTKRSKRKAGEVKALESLQTVGLSNYTRSLAGSLSHGYKKPLEIAMAFAFKTKLLLLDEPTAGLSSEEARQIVLLLNNLHRATGITILIVEHNMDVVFSFAQKITVLHFGRIIAEGTPEEIKKDEKVIKAYLGES
jgi:branched-chain amino acid transport system ATP-binding protein